MMKLSPRTMLPTMILCGAMVLSLRVGDIWHSITEGALFDAVAPVHAEVQAKTESSKKETVTEAVKKKKKETKKDKSNDQLVSDEERRTERKLTAESRLYRQLAGRRDQLDKRARTLDEREALVAVAEHRIDQKITEMQKLRKQLETLLGQANGAQQQQLTNLVKVYESMKPKEAARIFEELNIKILLGVIQRMKPKNTAKVLAAMDPLKAKEITVALTRRDKLPQLK